MFKALTIERHGDYTYLKFSEGVRLKWSSDSMSIFLTVTEEFEKKTVGLCGDYDHDNRKDFILQDGSYTSEPSRFGNEWRTDSGCQEVPPMADPCKNSDLNDEASYACKALIDPSDSFKTCGKLVNV
jgi:hypothetical protein